MPDNQPVPIRSCHPVTNVRSRNAVPASAQVYVKDGKIKQIQTLIAGEITPYDYIASATADFKEVKNTDTLLDGFNCVRKIRTKSLTGEKFGAVNGAVIESGKIKAGKAKDAITGVEIVDEICGIDCEEL